MLLALMEGLMANPAESFRGAQLSGRRMRRTAAALDGELE